ncbi:MAG: alpha/beta fold hydrolase [Planctomycetota bacterium]|jgi:pimeloyl-ACP methyl ester carboxylesterase
MRLILHIIALALLSLASRIHAQPLPDRTLSEVTKVGNANTTLILVPCMSCRWKQWEQFLERNKDKYTMYAVTLPGFGGGAIPNLPMDANEPIWHKNAVAALSALIDDENLDDVILLTNSFGAFIGAQLAVERPDAVRAIIDLDGRIITPSNNPETLEERAERANANIADWTEKFRDPEQWQQFNRVASYHNSERRMLYHGWFMATDPQVMLRYWSENFFVDKEDVLGQLDIPFVHVRALSPAIEDQEDARQKHLDSLSDAARRENVEVIFFYQTYHFIMDSQPEALDALVAAFVNGEDLEDFHPNEAANN